MKLATIRTHRGTQAVRIEDDTAVELGASTLEGLLSNPDWNSRAASAEGPQHSVDEVDYAPLVVWPEKVLCVGLNYRAHALEAGYQLPEYPTLFTKYPRSLIGAHDNIILPSASDAMDWEVELAVILGSPVRHAGHDEARNAIAGYSVLNDISARDWQNRTPQWWQGKTFDHTTPVGPLLVTDDAQAEEVAYSVSCAVGEEIVQNSNTKDLLFEPAALVAYISTITTLVPGDVIATGTPGGVGHARDPKRYLRDGHVLTTRIEGIGQCSNVCRRERS